jgi:hypothetical protein
MAILSGLYIVVSQVVVITTTDKQTSLMATSSSRCLLVFFLGETRTPGTVSTRPRFLTLGTSSGSIWASSGSSITDVFERPFRTMLGGGEKPK